MRQSHHWPGRCQPSIVCLETGSRSARESSSKHGEAVSLQGDHLTIQWPLEILQVESGNLPPAATRFFVQVAVRSAHRRTRCRPGPASPLQRNGWSPRDMMCKWLALISTYRTYWSIPFLISEAEVVYFHQNFGFRAGLFIFFGKDRIPKHSLEVAVSHWVPPLDGHWTCPPKSWCD